MFRSFLRPATVFAVLVALGAYATILLRGPQGLAALSEKRQEVRALEESNADLVRDIQAKRLRIERLKNDTNTQELEVRKRLKMQREGEMRFVLPNQKIAPDGGGSTSSAQ